jgi:hypothetical protein
MGVYGACATTVTKKVNGVFVRFVHPSLRGTNGTYYEDWQDSVVDYAFILFDTYTR